MKNKRFFRYQKLPEKLGRYASTMGKPESQKDRQTQEKFINNMKNKRFF